jgi:hypothetical protein
MRVLGKPELDDAVRYDELELLLGNFGAPAMTPKNITEPFSLKRD